MLVVGAGPAGLEATRALGQRGYQVMLAERDSELGGRVLKESRLPGLSEWIRVRDYRVRQIQQMQNVQMYPASEMNASEILETNIEHVVLATGASWRADGFGRYHSAVPEKFGPAESIFTPDDIFNGRYPACLLYTSPSPRDRG